MVVENSYAGDIDMAKVEQIAQDPMKHVLTVIEKKVRNLDKRKAKLEGYKNTVSSGGILDPDQEAAVNKYKEVIGSLEFAKELQKAFSTLSAEVSKAEQKNQRREQVIREEDDRKFCQFVIKVTNVLKLLSSEKKIQEDFLIGRHNAVVLTQNEIDQLTEFYSNTLQLPPTACNILKDSETAGTHLHLLYEASNEVVGQSSYNSLHSIIGRVFKCAYFEDLPSFQVSAHEEKNDDGSVASSSSLDGNNFVDNSSEETDDDKPNAQDDDAKEVLNASETDAVPFDAGNDQVNSELQTTSTAQPQPNNVQATGPAPTQSLRTLDFQFTAVHSQGMEAADPQHSKQTIEEVLADVQGQYNFLQDSMLDVEAPIPNAAHGPVAKTNHVETEPLHIKSPGYQGEQDAIQATTTPNHSNFTANSVCTRNEFHDKHSTRATNNDSNLAHDADNLGMGQTTFGSDPSHKIDMPPATTYSNVESDNSYGAQPPTLADPPATHIPLPNEKSSGYKSYVSAAHCEIVPASEPETPGKLYNIDQQDVAMSHVLAAGDAEPAHVENIHSSQAPNKVPHAQPDSVEDSSKPLPDNGKPLRSGHGSKGKTEQNTGYHNSNYRSNPPRQQAPPPPNNYPQQRQNHYRGGGRSYGNFDSMGHPKNYTGSAYPPTFPQFNTPYNRQQQDNGMFGGGPRRGANGPNKNNRGYAMRNHARPTASYNRSRTFRAQNSEQST